MRRREFTAGLGGAAAWPLLVRAQQQTKPIIGWLDVRPGGPARESVEGFRRGLAEVGFSEGRDVTVEYHTGDGNLERLPALAAGLVRRRPAAIVAGTSGGALAAKAATRDIPIIFSVGTDPVEFGLVASLNRPGGNLTGIVALGAEIAEKRLELLHQAVPAAETIAFLVDPADDPYSAVETRHMQSAARTLGLRLLVFNLVAPFQPNLLAVDLGAREALGTEITQVFATLVGHQAGAVLMGTSSEISSGAMKSCRMRLVLRYPPWVPTAVSHEREGF